MKGKKGIKLLLVDDEADFRQATGKILGRRGFTISEAESGAKALEAIRADRPDIVILDLKMPGLSGIETLEKIREFEPKLPVLILTGHGSFDDDLNQGKVKYFWDYYSSTHTFNGYMDYFKNPADVKGNGLRDLIVRSGITPMENLNCKLDLHHFSVAEPFPSAVDGSDADQLGMELDATAVYNIRKGLSVELGLDFFMPSEEWKGKDGKTAIFSYLTFTAKL